MNQYEIKPMKQLALLEGRRERKNHATKRVNILSLKLVKESSLLYKDCGVCSPENGYRLLKQFPGEVAREYFILIILGDDQFVLLKEKGYV